MAGHRRRANRPDPRGPKAEAALAKADRGLEARPVAEEAQTGADLRAARVGVAEWTEEPPVLAKGENREAAGTASGHGSERSSMRQLCILDDAFQAGRTASVGVLDKDVRLAPPTGTRKPVSRLEDLLELRCELNGSRQDVHVDDTSALGGENNDHTTELRRFEVAVSTIRK